MKLSFPAHTYAARRKKLLTTFCESSLNKSTETLFIIPGAYESARAPFRQESALWYLTGVTEPGAVCVISSTGDTTVFIPNAPTRATWVESPLQATTETARALGVTTVREFGEPIKGYAISPLWSAQEGSALIALLTEAAARGAQICTFVPAQGRFAEELFIERLLTHAPTLRNSLTSIIPALARIRRTKSSDELARMREAIELTMIGHTAAAQSIAPGVRESEIVAGIEFVFAESGARPAFPSIVASGKASTILHYTSHTQKLVSGGLVVVDIGAEIDGYAADISRTYPINGTFSKRQREVYDIVLATQEQVLKAVKPGVWLNNKEKPMQSLHHRAVAYLTARGYEKYFAHSIGHFLGLDVHDIGDIDRPLEAGDVITVEPGIYIPAESLGVRIEDDVLVTSNGAELLSEELPRTTQDIESLMQGEDEEYDEE